MFCKGCVPAAAGAVPSLATGYPLASAEAGLRGVLRSEGREARFTVCQITQAVPVRQHWSIENSLHWRLDVVMNEDQDRTRAGNGAHNLAVLRHMVINAMQKEGSKGSMRGKFKRAGWDDRFLFRLLEMF